MGHGDKSYDYPLPEPRDSRAGVFCTSGLVQRDICKDFYTAERLLALGLSDRQVQAVHYAREQGAITNKGYRENSKVSTSLALRELNDLCTRGIFMKRGKTGRNTEYILNKARSDEPSTNPS